MKAEEQRPTFEVWVAIVAAYLGVLGATLSGDAAALHLLMFAAGLVIGLALLYRFRGKPLSYAMVPAMIAAVLVIGLASFSLIEGIDINALNKNRDSIRATIIGGIESQLAWFKMPTKVMTPTLEKYYVPEADGGGALSETRCIVQRLQSEGKRDDDSSSGAVFFEAIDVHSDTAFVKTFEAYYLPQVKQQSGESAGLAQLSGEQVYILKKQNGRWRIQANPFPAKTPTSPCPSP
jgi:hypothetical protein